MVAAAAAVVAIVVVSFRLIADRDSEPQPRSRPPTGSPSAHWSNFTVIDDVGVSDSSRNVVVFNPAAQRVYVSTDAEGRRAGGVAVVDATSQTLVDTVEIV